MKNTAGCYLKRNDDLNFKLRIIFMAKKSNINITFPKGFDWKSWVRRWDRMQERYLIRRDERFDIIIQLIKDTQKSPNYIVDLGCGTGSLTSKLLEAFPEAKIYGIDIDPTLLPLAKERTACFGNRIHLIRADLRNPMWIDSIPKPVDSIVSATTLHWLNVEHLKNLYHQISSLLKPGGIFLNADHTGNDNPLIQKSWEQHREQMRKGEQKPDMEDWESFWNAYLNALGNEARNIRQNALGDWEGIEEGLPLTWHFDQLRESGFSSVDCFWRCDCDAIYGGIRD